MQFTIDPLHSLVEFSVQHLKISIVKGRFSEVRGLITLDPQNPEKASVKAQVTTDSIYTGASQRDAHLRSADFFDVSRYPTITFESTQVKLVDQTRCWLVGNLSLHGITQQVAFQAAYTGTNRDPLSDALRIGLNAKTKIDRREFGMNFGSKNIESIAVVGNETIIEIYVEAIQID
jgi:polyisoprenoid-binding protein YceI